MKKYKISAFYVGIYVCSMAFFLVPIAAFGLYCIIHVDPIWGSIPFIVGIIGIVAMAYSMLFDFQMGSFMINESMIIMKVGLREYKHKWNDFADYGFVKAYVGNGYLYWVYLSTYELSAEQRRRFLKKTRRDLKNIAFFKYNDSKFDEIIGFMPSAMAKKLKEDEIEVREQMSWLEEIHH